MANSVFIWPGLFSDNGSAVTFPGDVTITGNLTVNSVTTLSTLTVGNSSIFWGAGQASGDLVQIGDGLTRFRDSAGHGFVLRETTTGIMGVRTVANAGYGSVDAAAYLASGANGQSLGLQSLSELTTIAASPTTTTTIQMPAGAIVMAVSVRTTVVIPTATSYSVGDSGSATRFNTANVGVAATSTDAGTKAGAYYNATATGILLTMNGGTPGDNTGRVRVTIFYFLSTPPTS